MFFYLSLWDLRFKQVFLSFQEFLEKQTLSITVNLWKQSRFLLFNVTPAVSVLLGLNRKERKNKSAPVGGHWSTDPNEQVRNVVSSRESAASTSSWPSGSLWVTTLCSRCSPSLRRSSSWSEPVSPAPVSAAHKLHICCFSAGVFPLQLSTFKSHHIYPVTEK